MTASERRRLEAVLPFYLNGRADAADRAFVEALQSDPQASAMLAWHRSLAERVAADVESAPANIGWAALMGKVQAERAARQAPATGWRAWLALERWLPRPVQMPAFAVLALAVVVQGALLGGLWPQGDAATAEPEYSAVRGIEPVAATPSAALLRVSFKDETSERDLRLLLVGVGANIVQGPGQLGDYTLAVPMERADAALAEMSRSEWVVVVRRVDHATTPR